MNATPDTWLWVILFGVFIAGALVRVTMSAFHIRPWHLLMFAVACWGIAAALFWAMTVIA